MVTMVLGADQGRRWREETEGSLSSVGIELVRGSPSGGDSDSLSSPYGDRTGLTRLEPSV